MSNTFANVIRNEATRDANHVYTLNGADALASSLNACVDLFALIGAMRNRSEDDLIDLIDKAYAEDPQNVMRIIFYARDIRYGLGERKAFRTAIRYLAEKHPDAVRPNIRYIGEYGRFDDLYTLIDTPCENDMWSYMYEQLLKDIADMRNNKPVSLLAKWIKTPDASSANTRKLGCLTAKKLGFNVYDFKRILRKLRKHIRIVETQMSANEWDNIAYETVPARASMIYRNAFRRHDNERYTEYIDNVMAGKSKINAATLYPYDITEKFLYKNLDETEKSVLEAQWNALPNYIDTDNNCLIMADVSGSMDGRPMATSIGLALYFAERTKGPFANLFMTFSTNPGFVAVTGNTLEEKIRNAERADWRGSTDLEKAFARILKLAVKNNAKQDEMPDSLVIISDMQFNSAIRSRNAANWQTFYDTISDMYTEAGYKMPNIVFWNVNAIATTFHSDAEHKGVQLVSGQSPSVFKSLISSIGMSPIEYMLSVINSERYAAITVKSAA